MKKCCKCKQEKEEICFSKNKSMPKGINNDCKDCRKVSRKEHYNANLDKYKQYSIAGHKKKTDTFLKLLEGKSCADCGNDNIIVLEFDHQRDKIGNIAKMKQGSLSLLLDEISKCDIVCANCHKIRTSKQFNWAKAKVVTNGQL